MKKLNKLYIFLGNLLGISVPFFGYIQTDVNLIKCKFQLLFEYSLPNSSLFSDDRNLRFYASISVGAFLFFGGKL